MRTFILTFICTAIVNLALAEEIVFEMSVWGYKFGTMVVTKTQQNDSTEVYTLHAKGKTDFLWMQREEESLFEVRYINGTLRNSDYIYKNKGEKEKWSTMELRDGKYYVNSNDGSKILSVAADYSLIKLYFEPGWNRDQVLCEEDCSYADLVRDEKEKTIKVMCKDGSKSTYHLENGKITAMDIHLAVATVKLTRIS